MESIQFLASGVVREQSSDCNNERISGLDDTKYWTLSAWEITETYDVTTGFCSNSASFFCSSCWFVFRNRQQISFYLNFNITMYTDIFANKKNTYTRTRQTKPWIYSNFLLSSLDCVHLILIQRRCASF